MIKHYHIDFGISKTHKLRNILIGLPSFLLILLGFYSGVFSRSGVKPVEESKAALNQVAQTPATTTLSKLTTPMPWPSYGYSAFAVPKDSLIAESDTADQSVPIASLAKVITALALLKEKPLKAGEQGTTLTLTDRDVEIYSDYVRKNGSVTYVEAGEQISQYQALQAILMPSSNNIADSLVIQTFGSIEKYNEYANNMVKELGLNNTKVADASGYSPATVSTAEDMTKLGYLYMQNPVLREIAMQKEATIPTAGEIKNYNSFINDKGFVGIKVGDTDAAGKCFMIADVRKVGDGNEEISVAVVLGADSLKVAARDAEKILKAGNLGHDQLDKVTQ